MLAPAEPTAPPHPAPRAPFRHISVLRDEVVAAALHLRALNRPLRLVDATLGGGGHASALLEALPDARLLGIDRDPAALSAAGARLTPFGSQVMLRASAFADLPHVLRDAGWLAGADAGVDLVLIDLGVSSHQLDEAQRGFSFRHDAPLDMRMDPHQSLTAAALLQDIEPDALAMVLRDFGEERYARRVARAICQARPTRTLQLADIVRGVLPKQRFYECDPATRTFQALRIAVNDELGQLQRFLAALPAIVRAGGLAMGISFHSLEDRALKRAFVAFAQRCSCPPKLPICSCGRVPSFVPLGKQPQGCSVTERRLNPRARSAKLRVVVRQP